MKLLHCELYWEWNPFLDGGFSKWRTHTRRINGTSNVFFFVMHHYEALNLSAKGICALWSPGWYCNYYRSTLSLFTVGGGTCGEKIDRIKLDRCFTAVYLTTFTYTFGMFRFFWLILMKSLLTMMKMILF